MKKITFVETPQKKKYTTPIASIEVDLFVPVADALATIYDEMLETVVENKEYKFTDVDGVEKVITDIKVEYPETIYQVVIENKRTNEVEELFVADEDDALEYAKKEWNHLTSIEQAYHEITVIKSETREDANADAEYIDEIVEKSELLAKYSK